MKKVRKTLSRWSKETYDNFFQKVATFKDITRVKETQIEIQPSPANREELKKPEVEF